MSSSNRSKALAEKVGKPDFQVRFHHCQNTCWQGELHWLNTGEKISFRSLLELVMLMQEAVEISGEPESEYNIRKWMDYEVESKNAVIRKG